MKINWGTGIVIAFALFISFILYFVLEVQGNVKYDNEMVVEEYYKHDARYSEELAKLQNAQDLKEKPAISMSATNIVVVFPDALARAKVRGKVSLYRPSAKKLDFERPFELSGTALYIAKSDLAGGKWNMTLSWSYLEKEYLTKTSIYIK